jgi:NAD(P)-dependent dehydrogenase (short-subunit alcohol dehydrogenase family)
LGRIDLLVNNAGVSSAQKFTSIDDQTWLDTFAVNLNAPFYITKAALPGMLTRRLGCVIAINSIASKIGAAYIAPYSASKHALLGMMRSLAAEYARSGVTFNCVCPAYVDTPMTEKSVQNIMEKTGRSREEAVATLLTPQGRLIQPEEVAAVCVLLASESGRSINGQAINVDGGQVPW